MQLHVRLAHVGLASRQGWHSKREWHEFFEEKDTCLRFRLDKLLVGSDAHLPVIQPDVSLVLGGMCRNLVLPQPPSEPGHVWRAETAPGSKLGSGYQSRCDNCKLPVKQLLGIRSSAEL